MFENPRCSEHYLCYQLIKSVYAGIERCTPQENAFCFQIPIVNKTYRIKMQASDPPPPIETKITTWNFFRDMRLNSDACNGPTLEMENID